jgi:hypothetical protein
VEGGFSLNMVAVGNGTIGKATRPRSRAGRLRPQLWLALVVVALVAVLVAAAMMAYHVAWSRTQTRSAEWGTCHGLTHTTCTDVPLSTIERDSGLSLPGGTVIVSSGSTGPNIYNQGSIRAELLLPKGAASPLQKQMEHNRRGYSAAWNEASGLNELKARGLRNVAGFARPPSSFVQGLRLDGRVTMIIEADDPHH